LVGEGNLYISSLFTAPARDDGAVRRLLTIPISHFCEKARWALDRAGLD
jgi:hypothetical protein